MTYKQLSSNVGTVVLIPFLIFSCNLPTTTLTPETETETSISTPLTPRLTPTLPSQSPLLPTANLTEEPLIPTPNGNAYYVSPKGNDANPGTETQPWQTIQKAADTLIAGDTVYIRAGTYHERVVPQNSGEVDKYITFVAYPGEVVTIDGQGISIPEWSGLFDVSTKSFIKISGLRIINSNKTGILADTSNHIIIDKNHTHNTFSSGIGVWSSKDIIIDGNEV
jgi:hypothetical protein